MTEQIDTGRRLFEYVELVSVGIDWLTVTAQTPAGKRALGENWLRHRDRLARLGETLKKGGFQGYVGESIGELFFGRREDGFLLKVSSSAAEGIYSELPMHELHTTRIDLQATVRLTAYNPDIGKILADRRDAKPRPPGQKLKPKQNVRLGYGEGDTYFIGGRSSPRFGRVYDKDKESGDERYANCWRFEVEYKKLMAPKIVEYLQQEKHLHGAIIDVLKGQFDEWGIELPVVANGVLVAGSIGRRSFDSDRTMTWLRDQVAPSIERLLGTVDREDVLEALGLSDQLAELPPVTRAFLAARHSSAPR